MSVSHSPLWRPWETSPIAITLLLCFSLFFFVFLYATSKDEHGAEMYHLGGYPMVSAWLFFTKRYDFMCGTFKKTGQKMFRFRVLQHHVVALSGEEGRKAFLSEKNFNIQEGYRILGGPVPDPRDININPIEGAAGLFVKHVLDLFRKDRIMELIPNLLEDVNERMGDWGRSGKIDPFQETYNLLFQMTIRMATCRELADDPHDTARLSELFLLHEQAASPISLLLPWLPGRAKQTKEKATRALFDLLSAYVDLRRKSSVRSTDAIDMLIADGHDDVTVIAFTLGVIPAGVVNTGLNVCWTIIHLGGQPAWKAKVVDEVKALLFNHGRTTGPMDCRFSAIPLAAWEGEMPVLDAVIKETIRFTMAGTALRRNLGGDILISHKTVRNGDFLAYSLGDIHFDNEIYPNPLSFDPARFLEKFDQREKTSKVPFPFLGWGAGRHPCAGMRGAKLEIKLVIALFLSKFEYSLVDDSGKTPKCLPQPDWNNIQLVKPSGDPCYLKLERLEII
ncbi:cytochrome P450 [Mycena filopes]|nr:cytochrome P450 [Mycena filopes]